METNAVSEVAFSNLPSEEEGMAFAAHAAAQAFSEIDAAAGSTGDSDVPEDGDVSQVDSLDPTPIPDGSAPGSNSGGEGENLEDTDTNDTHHHHHSNDTQSNNSVLGEEDEAVGGAKSLICRVCQQGDDDGRPILRFLPVEHDGSAATAAPSVVTFTEDIGLHIFCGKTASILPTVNRPDLEILTKAGLKNKHGIGPEVNAALARTRCAILTEGSKEKQFYLVREFEAHLAAIRHTHISFVPEHPNAVVPVATPHLHDAYAAHAEILAQCIDAPMPAAPGAMHSQQHPHLHQMQTHNIYEGLDTMDDNGVVLPAPAEPQLMSSQSPSSSVTTALHNISDAPQRLGVKLAPSKANAGQHQKQGRQRYSNPPTLSTSSTTTANSNSNTALHLNQHYEIGSTEIDAAVEANSDSPQSSSASNIINNDPELVFGSEVIEDGKVQCACGGTHFSTGSSKGEESWRSHITTKQHQKWLETQGLLGAV